MNLVSDKSNWSELITHTQIWLKLCPNFYNLWSCTIFRLTIDISRPGFKGCLSSKAKKGWRKNILNQLQYVKSYREIWNLVDTKTQLFTFFQNHIGRINEAILISFKIFLLLIKYHFRRDLCFSIWMEFDWWKSFIDTARNLSTELITKTKAYFEK